MTPTPYENLLQHILKNGTHKTDRTGTGTISSFGHQLRYNLAEAFPLITTKKVHFPSVAEELFWFLRGETNTKTLNATIWDEWQDENGELGPVYGFQWRSWPKYITKLTKLQGSTGAIHEKERHVVEAIDQIANIQKELRENPDSRRHLVSAWNISQIDQMALPPCHYAHQYYVADGKLSILVNQRSADMFLGVPFNIASYALLCHLMADVVGLEVGELVWNGGDCHIYSNHIEQVEKQLARESRPYPQLNIVGHHENVWEYMMEDIEVVGYNPHPTIKAPVAI